MSVLRQGLGRSLLLWFLALSLIPLAAVSLLSYRSAYNSLLEEKRQALTSISMVKTEYLRFYLLRILTDLRQQAGMMVNARFLEELRRAFVASGRPLDEFVGSNEWVALVEERGADLRSYRATYDYHDVFLLDDRGNVLFTLFREADLGTNVLTGPYSDTLFAGACRKALEDGAPAFSDFEFYEPSGGLVSSFLVAPVVDQRGETIGLMALQSPIDLIDEVMQDRAGLGATGETYLVGADLKMRSNSYKAGERTALREVVDTELTALWKRNLLEPDAAPREPEEIVVSYVGPNGQRVLGHHRNLEILGVNWAVVAEIETSEAFAAARLQGWVAFGLLLGTGLVIVIVAIPVTRRILRPILELTAAAGRVAAGDLDQEIAVKGRNEVGVLARGFGVMLAGLRHARGEREALDWLKTGQAGLNELLRGEHDIPTLCRHVVTYLAKYLNAQIGALYLAAGDHRLHLVASYAYQKRKALSNAFELGEGLVGQAALEKERILLTNVPADYFVIQSGLGGTAPRNVVVLPFLREEELKGVIELGTLAELSELDLELLEGVAESVGIAVETAQSRQRVEELLARSREQTEELQIQTEELQTREEELRQTNEALEEQARLLRESEQRLQQQQEELQQANEMLEEQAQVLEEERNVVAEKNQALEAARQEIEEKVRELEMASGYKSEFLANMSHELRTPLNSLLILSRLLQENREGNLNAKQIEFVQTIQSSGEDLLELINDVLDLTLVEAGRLELNLEKVRVRDLFDELQKQFQPIADDQGLELSMQLAEGLPAEITTDEQRLGQVLKNLLSNAFKFTEQGSVTVSVARPEPEAGPLPAGLDPARTLAFAVADTGVGIAATHQRRIFEAFQQVDGTTARKYGGTGLGLAIAQALVGLLGGTIQLVSAEGTGSRFTVLLPESPEVEPPEAVETLPPETAKPPPPAADLAAPAAPRAPAMADDRDAIEPHDRTVLIIEDDAKFARILRDLAREKGFKALVAEDGESGLELATSFAPSGILLDLRLPGLDGMVVLDRLKENLTTRHIPVHVISALPKELEVLRMGALGFFAKPVNPNQIDEALGAIEGLISGSPRRLLVVEDDARTRDGVVELIRADDIEVETAATGAEALDLLRARRFDCVVLDLTLPDVAGVELLESIRADGAIAHTPMIVFTGKELTRDEQLTIDRYAERIIIKGVKSVERLVDETALFLHRVEKDLPEEKRRMIRKLHDKEAIFAGKKVLLVDDDVRTLFALGAILEERGIELVTAENGSEALAALEANPDVDAVLMDIMMPGMDGYETMGRIRKEARFDKLPIIALTAKAMKGDRAKCIEAGASDYLAKPVDADKVLSMLRVWLY